MTLYCKLARQSGQLALITVGTMQGRLLLHSCGVKGTTFLTYLVPADKEKAREPGASGNAGDLRNSFSPWFTDSSRGGSEWFDDWLRMAHPILECSHSSSNTLTFLSPPRMFQSQKEKGFIGNVTLFPCSILGPV